MNLLLEVKSIRRCDGGHTCNLTANGKKVAFIAPGIFEWSSHSHKTDVITWFVARKKLKIEIQPVELKEGWESTIPDHKFDDEKDKATETLIHQWIKLHFKAYEIVQRCKSTIITINTKGKLMDWGVPPRKGGDAVLKLAKTKYNATPLNGLAIPQIVKLMEERLGS